MLQEAAHLLIGVVAYSLTWADVHHVSIGGREEEEEEEKTTIKYIENLLQK